MSKAYVCDSCGKAIVDPHEVKMKEFYIAAECDVCGVFPVNAKRMKKIHLCEKCYKGLKEIGGRVKAGENNNGKCSQIACPNYKKGVIANDRY